MDPIQLKKLKLIAIEKERRRREEAQKGEEIREDISGRFSDFMTVPSGKEALIMAGQGATYGFADEIAGKWAEMTADPSDKRSKEQIYKEARNKLRDETALAREKSPFFSFVIENLAGMAPTKVLGTFPVIGKAMRDQGLFSTAAESTAIGIGESEKEGTKKQLIHGGIAGGFGTGMHLGAKFVKAPFKKPSKIRSKAFGATKDEMKRLRGQFQDPEKVGEELRKRGFFHRGGATFDLKTLKFKKDRKGRELYNESILEDMDMRANEADEMIWQEKQRILNKHQTFDISTRNVETGKIVKENRRIMPQDITSEPRFAEMMDNHIKTSRDQTAARKRIEKIEDELQESIGNPVEIDNVPTEELMAFGEYDSYQGASLMDLEQVKRNYQEASERLYRQGNLAGGETKQADLYKDVANYLREYIEAAAGQDGARIRELNRVSSRLKSMKGHLNAAIAGESGPKLPGGITIPTWLLKVGEQVGLSPSGSMRRAGVGQFFKDLPGTDTFESMIRTAPAREGMKMLAPDRGREPQSIPKQLIRKKFPRSTQAIIENKDMVKAKIAQQAPEMFDIVSEVLDHREEDIADIIPALTQVADFLFEKDKYNRFDGIIHDPQMKEVARADTMKNDNLSNIEKIEIIDHLNKTGEFLV